MKTHGIKSETIHAGRNKIMGNFTEPVTEEQRKIMQTIADECYEQFTGLVAQNRKLPLDKVKELADGRIYTAKQAQEAGLVDKVLTIQEAQEIIYQEIFKNKDYKEELEEHKYKAKVPLFKKFLKNTCVPLDTGSILAKAALKSTQMPFPAYFYDSGRY